MNGATPLKMHKVSAARTTIIYFLKFAMINPNMMMVPAIKCMVENFSPNIITASMVLNIGMRLAKMTVLDAPIFAMDAFQQRNPMTELPMPK